MAVTAQTLIEAEFALHSLITGTAVVEVIDQNGEKIRYAQARRGDLVLYIQLLKAELGLLTTGSGPMMAYF